MTVIIHFTPSNHPCRFFFTLFFPARSVSISSESLPCDSPHLTTQFVPLPIIIKTKDCPSIGIPSLQAFPPPAVGLSLWDFISLPMRKKTSSDCSLYYLTDPRTPCSGCG